MVAKLYLAYKAVNIKNLLCKKQLVESKHEIQPLAKSA